MEIRLGTQDKPFFSTDLIEKFQQIKDLGFDNFEIDGKLLVTQFEKVKEAMEKTGLKVNSICGGYDGWIGDFKEERRQQGLKDITAILECAGEIGAKGIVVPAAWGMFSLRLPPMVPPRSSEDDKKILIDSLKTLDAVAERTGTTIYLEPLNRYEDHMLNTLDAAADIIRMGELKHTKVMPDFFHMNIEEAHISESLKKHSDVNHIHIASSHRYQPGTGHTDYAKELQVLREIDFNGDIVMESRVIGENPMEDYRNSVKYIRECISAVLGGK